MNSAKVKYMANALKTVERIERREKLFLQVTMFNADAQRYQTHGRKDLSIVALTNLRKTTTELLKLLKA